jgi:MarR-like DNA-binding transcriptional regulator SgrR of sgrS sRNA
MRGILVAGALALAVALGFVYSNRNQGMISKSSTIRVALQGEFPAGQISPENISTIALYHLHYNLWDNLLAPGGKPAVAKTFKASDDNLTFTFELDPEAKFSNGRQISARDIKDAFERIIAREENGHINARTTIREVSATPEGNLRIALRAPTPSFLFLLTTPEFGIVPKESLNEKGEVTNLAVTSGAYLAERVDAKAQKILLVKNPHFRRAEPNSPERVEISFLESMGADSLKSDYDFAEVRSSDADQIVSETESKGYAYKATVPSLSVFMVADSKVLSPDLQRELALVFKNEFTIDSPRGFETKSNQLLPRKTFGSLDQAELPLPEASSRPKLPVEIVISNNRSSGPLVDAIQKALAKAGSKARIVGLDSKEPAAYALTSQGMNTEFPEIELHLATVGPYAYFEASENTKKEVLAATHEPNDSQRSKIIKQVGKELIATGKIVPLTVRAYVHLYKPKTLDLNGITNYDGDIPFYKLRMAQ